MEQRIVEFITALRNAGVRVSVAESADALRAIDATGIADRDFFRSAMRTTLVKEANDIPTFESLFPSFFGTGTPPMPNQGPGSGSMSEEERQQLMQALEEMLRTMTPEQLRQMFESMMTGESMNSQDLRDMVQESMQGSPMTNPFYQAMMTRRAMRDMQFDRLEELLQELMEKLREAGVSEETLQQLAQEARENMEALGEQISKEVGAGMAQRATEERPKPQDMDQLMDRPFEHMRYDDVEEMRGVTNRLAAQLRSRASLRQRRGNKGVLDAKSTIRANLRFGGVPMEVRHRRKHLKPKLTVICDLSTSMRPVATFMLQMVYALQDQVSRTRSFAFIEDMEDISTDFKDARPETAIQEVLQRMRPGYYSTDLGTSLATFARDHMGAVDRRTTVIVLGDGRNNYNDPNLRDFEYIKRRARKLIWFNPENPRTWGTGDSDMPKYVPLCDTVHQVSNMRQLAAAVESLFTR
jgi:uncharacterized protein with von Willebrand factor type A (vWA) domain